MLLRLNLLTDEEIEMCKNQPERVWVHESASSVLVEVKSDAHVFEFVNRVGVKMGDITFKVGRGPRIEKAMMESFLRPRRGGEYV